MIALLLKHLRSKLKGANHDDDSKLGGCSLLTLEKPPHDCDSGRTPYKRPIVDAISYVSSLVATSSSRSGMFPSICTPEMNKARMGCMVLLLCV